MRLGVGVKFPPAAIALAGRFGLEVGARGAASGSSALLGDQFTGATVILSLSKERSAYAGNCIRISDSAGASPVNIGFSGNDLDMTSLAIILAGGRRYLDDWYDQSGYSNNATQPTLSRRYEIVIDGDGMPALLSDGLYHSTTGMIIADSASHKTTTIDAFIVAKLGYSNFDSAAYRQNIIGWMATSTASWWDSSRWAFGISDDSGCFLNRNGTENLVISPSYPATLPLSGGKRMSWNCYQFNTNRQSLRFNDTLLWDDVIDNGSSAANVTYSGTGQIYIGYQPNLSAESTPTRCNLNGSFRAIVLYGTTRADHASISNYLTNRWAVDTVYPTSWDSGDGFTWTPEYSATYNTDPSNDTAGLRYWYENPGYRDNGTRGPSQARANNVTNGVLMYRTAVGELDQDGIVTGAERCERGIRVGASGFIAVGDDFAVYADWYVEAGPDQTGSWADVFQCHCNGGSTADLWLASVKNGNFQVATQRGGAETNRGSAQPLSRGTWYSTLWKGHLSGGSSDTLQVYHGVHGSTLTKIVDVSGALYPTDSGGGFPKQGVYRGERNSDDAVHGNTGVFAIRWANQAFSKTITALDGRITSPTTLPTHA